MIRKLYLFLMLTVLIIVFGFGISFAAYEPPIDQMLVYIDTEGGVRAQIFDLAKVPIFCLYKTGDLLYSYFDEKYGCTTLMQGRMTPEDIDNLIRAFSEKGLDEWNEYYEDCPFKEMPVTRIFINYKNIQKRLYVTGMDYAMNNKIIPDGLISAYRKIEYFSCPDAVEYEPQKIVLYVKKLTEEPKGPGAKVNKWGSKIDLAPISEEAGLTGFGSIILDGKNAKNTWKDIRYKVPFSRPDSNVCYRQGKNFYSIGYRPLLLHELENMGKEEKKGKKK